jgi:hypothetical protein
MYNPRALTRSGSGTSSSIVVGGIDPPREEDEFPSEVHNKKEEFLEATSDITSTDDEASTDPDYHLPGACRATIASQSEGPTLVRRSHRVKGGGERKEKNKVTLLTCRDQRPKRKRKVPTRYQAGGDMRKK